MLSHGYRRALRILSLVLVALAAVLLAIVVTQAIRGRTFDTALWAAHVWLTVAVGGFLLLSIYYLVLSVTHGKESEGTFPSRPKKP